MKPTFFLGSPEYYKSETKLIDPKRAKEQWQRLKNHIETHNINVKVINSNESCIDNVYITDTALIINDFAIISKFNKVSRRGEEKFTADYLKNKMGLRLRYLGDEDGLYFEGGGDTRWSHNYTHIWFGYGAGRSTLKGIEAVEKILKEELGAKMPCVHKLRIEDKKTFHLDLAFLPLPNGRALYYPSLSLAAIKQIEIIFGKHNVIKVPSKYFFACNSVYINEKILMIPKLGYDEYRKWMYMATKMKLDEVNVNQFHLGNGSVQCMILRWIRI
jgi:N-dimethylarginine dimethylaminohydrolase